MATQIRICAENHCEIFDQNEFCVVMQLATDPLIQGVMRKKFYGWPLLPKPRPNQACFLYNKLTNKYTRLWVLPEAGAMATLSEMPVVHSKYASMRAWSISFFRGTFWDDIRKEHSILMLSGDELAQVQGKENGEFCV